MAGYSTTTLPTKTAVFSDEENHFNQKFDDTIIADLDAQCEVIAGRRIAAGLAEAMPADNSSCESL